MKGLGKSKLLTNTGIILKVLVGWSSHFCLHGHPLVQHPPCHACPRLGCGCDLSTREAGPGFWLIRAKQRSPALSAMAGVMQQGAPGPWSRACFCSCFRVGKGPGVCLGPSWPVCTSGRGGLPVSKGPTKPLPRICSPHPTSKQIRV